MLSVSFSWAAIQRAVSVLIWKLLKSKRLAFVSCSKEAVDLLLGYYKTLIARELELSRLLLTHTMTQAVSLVSDFLKEQEKTVWMLVAVSSQNCAE